MPLRHVNRLFVASALLLGSLVAASARADEKLPDTVVPLDRNVPRHQQINERAKQGNVDLLFIGDSITAGWEGAGKEVWKKYYEPRKAMNAGIGGDRTQHVLWRLDHGNIDGLSPKLAVLMIGTNNFGANSAEDIALGVKAIVEKLRTKLPETKILVLGVFPRGEKIDDPLRQKDHAVNDIIKNLADGKLVHYLNINDKLLGPDGTQDRKLMPDLVHLSPAGYQIWADAIEPKVVELLGEKK
jgi:beta-glucosidase